tara:strand:+ start:2385 stop:2537 length:153 start_codon:yes stop_codon:yes gene_type:complete
MAKLEELKAARNAAYVDAMDAEAAWVAAFDAARKASKAYNKEKQKQDSAA